MSTDGERVPVSAVIPTVGRPELLARAVRSIVQQTTPPAQVVIVVDGPDEATLDRLEPAGAAMASAGIDVVTVARDATGGPAVARNDGVDAASQPMVAFLDDDDEWLPTKLETQLAACRTAADGAFVSGHAVLRQRPSGRADRVGDRALVPGESIAEYLFCRRRLGQHKGHLLTPTLLMPTELARRHRFDATLRVHEDWDLLLRLDQAGTPVVQLVEPLAIWHVRSEHRPISEGTTGLSWSQELTWADRRRGLLGERAYSGFLLTVAIDRAVADGSWHGVRRLVSAALTGRPSAAELATLPLTVGLSERRRDAVARRFGRR